MLRTPVLLACALAIFGLDGLAGESQRRETLISSQRNVNVEGRRFEGTDATTGTPWSIHKQTLHGGRQEGVDVIVLDNGRLKLTVVPTRGMSVLEVAAGDLRLGWDSPVKQVVHPKFINLQSRGGLGWLEGFNEWMVRCGLEWAGHPGTDTFVNNVGEEASMELTLHGKVGNIPASEVEVFADEGPPYRIGIRGRVDERMFYGPKLEMWTEVSTTPGAMHFQIDDLITNRGDAEQEFQLIYHANYGPPLLEKGARLVAPIKHIAPFNDHAAKDIDGHAAYAGPTSGFVEQVYCIHPYADKEGRTTIALHNADADKAVSMSWSLAQLPYLTQWKNTLTVPDGYVTGLEPGTGFPYNRRVERQFGRVPKLKPGESRRFSIEFGIHEGRDEVRQIVARVARVQGDRKTEVGKNPANTMSTLESRR